MIAFRDLARLAAAAGLAASSFAGVAAAQTVAHSHPGFGKDERRPQGAPFVLPPGVRVAGPIMGADDDGNCPRPRTKTAGSGLWVRVCVPLKNMNGGPVIVTFPPGLVVVSASEGFQHGLLVEREVITVPPTEPGGGGRPRDKDEQAVIYVPVHLYCLNNGRSESNSRQRYEMGPVTQHAGLSDLYRWMEGHDFKNDRDRVEVLQEVVWEVIAKGKLTAEHREDLRRGWYSAGAPK